MWSTAFLVILLGFLPYLIQSLQPPPSRLAVTLDVIEELPQNQILTNLITDARLEDYYSATALSALRFELMSHSLADLVLVDAQGNVYVKERIDRDTLCPDSESCDIVLDFTLQPIASFNNMLKLTLRVLDINDNAPEFPISAQRVDLDLAESANPGPGVQLVLPAASDADSIQNGVKEYRLTGDDEGVFELRVIQNQESVDDVSLILKKTLDREEMDRMDLKLIAFDGGTPPKSGSVDIRISIIDANDNPPVFSQVNYTVTVPEDTATGTTIVQVQATDRDLGENGLITYSLAASTSAEAAATFSINPATGEIYTLSSLDAETGGTHFLSVKARDNGAPTSLAAYTKVKITIDDVNDHAPEISVRALGGKEVEVLEGAPAGTFIAQVSVQDPDSGRNGEFTCSLDSQDFALQPMTDSEFKLLTTEWAQFDRETSPGHYVQITCTDHGFDSQQSTQQDIWVKVKDLNDHTPMFMQLHYNAEIEENNVPGSYITRVNATDGDIDQNARITYSIVPVKGPAVLDIQPGTGIVTATESLDYEKGSVYGFKVIATDQGQPPRSTETTLTLTVKDTNDCAPAFERDSYTFGTFENQPVNTEISTLKATDLDGYPYNIISYSLDRQNPHASKFHIDPNTGKLTTKRILDREEEEVYNLKVYASNEEYYLTGSVNVTIHIADKNDNAPVITYPNERNNTVVISTLTQANIPVIQILAYDLDSGSNQKLTFSILSGNEAGLFDIDKIHGWILTKQDLSDLPSQKETIVVLVQDNGIPVMSSVSQIQIQLNDSIAVLAHSQPQTISNTVAGIIISFLVLAIIVIVIVLVVLVVLRRLRMERIRKSLDQPDTLVMTSVNDATEAEDENKKNMEVVVMEDGSLQRRGEDPPPVAPRYYQQERVKGRQAMNGRHQMGAPQGRKRDECQLREIQLQVRDLLDAYPDPDRDSLTDSGKGPSEEGDQRHTNLDTSGSGIHGPHNNPHNNKHQNNGTPSKLPSGYRQSPTPSKLAPDVPHYKNPGSSANPDDTLDTFTDNDSLSPPPMLPPRKGKLPCKEVARHPYVNITIPERDRVNTDPSHWNNPPVYPNPQSQYPTNSLPRSTQQQRPSNPPLYREAIHRASFGPSAGPGAGTGLDSCPKHGPNSFRAFSPPATYTYNVPPYVERESEGEDEEGEHDMSGESTTTSGSFVLEGELSNCRDVFV